MNCKQVRRFLYSFADGELPVKDNCDVLDHLKMCPPCAGTVADQQALRRTLTQSLQSQSAPPHLLQNIHRNLAREASLARPPRRIFFLPRTFLAAAASLMLVVTVGYYGMSGNRSSHSAEPVIGQTAFRPVADEVLATHTSCCSHSRVQHQSRELADTLEGLRDSVATRFGATMEVFVPDLTDVGFKFDSANMCGIEHGRPGLHLIYARESDNARLSFFSVPRCTMKCRGFCNRGKREYYTDVRECDGVKYTVAGWQCSKGRSSFLACAPLPERNLLNMLEVVRMARLDTLPVPRPPTLLARLDSPSDRLLPQFQR